MSGHTPGPWTWWKVTTELEGRPIVTEWTLKGPTDVLCRFWYDKPPSSEALLIAAAPDMKERGNLLSSCAHDFLEEQTDINAERLALAVEGWNAAIAKATTTIQAEDRS